MAFRRHAYLAGTFLIAAAFAGLALFGSLPVEVMGNAGVHVGCVASLANGGVCPPMAPTLPSVNFHLGAAKNVSTVLLVSFFLAGLGLALTILLFNLTRTLLAPPLVAVAGKHALAQSLLRHKKITKWLSFHENSPPA